MKRIIQLTESKLIATIKRTINETQLLNEDWVKTCCDNRWVGFADCCDIIEDRDAGLIGPDWGNGRKGYRNIDEHTLPPPNQNHTHSTCVSSDCFMDISFTNGNQYGGTVKLEGCGVGNYTIYVNGQMQSSGGFPNTSIAINVGWQGATSPKMIIKGVLECTHPSSSPQSVTKTVCVQRSTGNVISCGKNIKTNKVPLNKSNLSLAGGNR